MEGGFDGARLGGRGRSMKRFGAKWCRSPVPAGLIRVVAWCVQRVAALKNTENTAR